MRNYDTSHSAVILKSMNLTVNIIFELNIVLDAPAKVNCIRKTFEFTVSDVFL